MTLFKIKGTVMIPFQGLIANILAVIALIVLWERPIPSLWLIILGFCIADIVLTQTVKNSIKIYGMNDKVSIIWGIITGIVQVIIIGLSIYAFTL